MNLEVEGLRERALQHGDPGAGELVGAHDAVGAPVGPVHVCLEHGDGERVRQRLVSADHLAVVAPLVVRRVHLRVMYTYITYQHHTTLQVNSAKGSF